MSERRHVWVTGANSGLGLAASKALTKAGWFVSMVCRSEQRGKQALAEVQGGAGADSARLVLCDLGSLKSVRRAAELVPEEHPTIHALVNNAGTIQTQRRVTDDGFEMQLAVNHLGHFLLTHLLLPHMAGTAAYRPQIVNVTSGAHKIGSIHWDDLQLEEKYGAFRAYSQSKLANILFTYELDRRLAGEFAVNCLHPGAVATNFGRESGGGLAAFIFTAFRPLFLTPERAALPLVNLVNQNEGAVSGKYFNKHKIERSAAASYDQETAQRLWKISEQMVGLTASERRASNLYA